MIQVLESVSRQSRVRDRREQKEATIVGITIVMSADDLVEIPYWVKSKFKKKYRESQKIYGSGLVAKRIKLSNLSFEVQGDKIHFFQIGTKIWFNLSINDVYWIEDMKGSNLWNSPEICVSCPGLAVESGLTVKGTRKWRKCANGHHWTEKIK